MRYSDAMSIKRSKQRSFSRRPGGDDADFGFLQSNGPEKSWEDQIKGQADDAFTPYSVTAKYNKGSCILHPKFGKGIVGSVEGSHVVVLFAEGVKKLGHGRTSQPPRVRPPLDADAMTEPGESDEDPAAALANEALASAAGATTRTGSSDGDPAAPGNDTETH